MLMNVHQATTVDRHRVFVSTLLGRTTVNVMTASCATINDGLATVHTHVYLLISLYLSLIHI